MLESTLGWFHEETTSHCSPDDTLAAFVTDPDAMDRLSESAATNYDELAIDLAALLQPQERLETDQVTAFFESNLQRYEVIGRFIDRLTTERPVVLYVDDVQWGFDTMGLVSHLMETRRQSPVLIMLTQRTDAIDADPLAMELVSRILKHDAAVSMTLDPLPVAELKKLIRSRLDLPEVIMSQVLARSQGSPLYTEELIRHLIRDRRLATSSGGFKLVDRTGPLLPESIGAVWEARLEPVFHGQPNEKYLAIELAAVMGMTIERTVWAEACQLAGLDTPDEIVEYMVDEQLAVVEDESRWSFSHVLLRESLCQRARRDGRRAKWNNFCADILLSSDVKDPDRLASHLIAANRLAEAIPPLLDAAMAFRERHENQIASRYAIRAARVAKKLGLKPTDRMMNRARIIWGACTGLLLENQAASLRHLKRSVALARQSNDEGTLASAIIELYLLEWTQNGDTRSALAGCREAVELAARAGDVAVEIQGLERLVKHLLEMDERDEVRETLDRALAILPPNDQSSRRGKLLIRKALLVKLLGEEQQALDILGEALVEGQRTGSRWVEAMAEMRFGEIRAEHGHLESSLRAYERSFRIFKEAGSASA